MFTILGEIFTLKLTPKIKKSVFFSIIDCLSWPNKGFMFTLYVFIILPDRERLDHPVYYFDNSKMEVEIHPMKLVTLDLMLFIFQGQILLSETLTIFSSRNILFLSCCDIKYLRGCFVRGFRWEGGGMCLTSSWFMVLTALTTLPISL